MITRKNEFYIMIANTLYNTHQKPAKSFLTFRKQNLWWCVFKFCIQMVIVFRENDWKLLKSASLDHLLLIISTFNVFLFEYTFVTWRCIIVVIFLKFCALDQILFIIFCQKMPFFIQFFTFLVKIYRNDKSHFWEI